jgi:hypothetical protein
VTVVDLSELECVEVDAGTAVFVCSRRLNRPSRQSYTYCNCFPDIPETWCRTIDLENVF